MPVCYLTHHQLLSSKRLGLGDVRDTVINTSTIYASVACTAGSTMTCATLLKHRHHTLLYFMEFEQINLGGFELGSFFF